MKVWRDKLNNLMSRAQKESENAGTVALVQPFNALDIDDDDPKYSLMTMTTTMTTMVVMLKIQSRM